MKNDWIFSSAPVIAKNAQRGGKIHILRDQFWITLPPRIKKLEHFPELITSHEAIRMVGMQMVAN